MALRRSGDQVTEGNLSVMSHDVLQRLAGVLEQRKQADPKSSYVAGLHHAGLNKILEKIGEEAVETILAAKDFANVIETNTGKTVARAEVIKETADLWFHTMVMLNHLNLDIDELLSELDNRFGTSGLAEKAARGN